MNPDVAKEIVLAIGAPEEVEMVFKLMEHATANADHPIKKFQALPDGNLNPNFHDTIFITGQSEK